MNFAFSDCVTAPQCSLPTALQGILLAPMPNAKQNTTPQIENDDKNAQTIYSLMGIFSPQLEWMPELRGCPVRGQNVEAGIFWKCSSWISYYSLTVNLKYSTSENNVDAQTLGHPQAQGLISSASACFCKYTPILKFMSPPGIPSLASWQLAFYLMSHPDSSNRLSSDFLSCCFILMSSNSAHCLAGVIPDPTLIQDFFLTLLASSSQQKEPVAPYSKPLLDGLLISPRSFLSTSG